MSKSVAELAIQDVWTNGDLSKIPMYYSPNFVGHMPPGEALDWAGIPADFSWIGHAGVEALVRAVRSVFPDYSETPQLVVQQGDQIAMRMINRGTHTGGTERMQASGKSFEIIDTMFVRLEDGLIAEQWSLIDSFSVGIQLGLIAEDTVPLLSHR